MTTFIAPFSFIGVRVSLRSSVSGSAVVRAAKKVMKMLVDFMFVDEAADMK
jgi:hypothetical protein